MSNKPKTASELLKVPTYGEMVRELSKEPGCIRIETNNSTVKFYGPNGMTLLHNHPSQQIKFGTKRSIIRMAVLAGIVASVLAIILML